MHGIFTISLDFELHWGGFEKWELGGSTPGIHDSQGKMISRSELRASGVHSSFRQYFLNTRLVIPEMLHAFESHGVHVTWAAVGLLFHDNKNELLANMPFLKPSLQQEILSAYHYIDNIGIGASETEDPFHYGLSLIRQIKNTRYQEIGSHTFAHYYACEAGQTADQFRADLQAAQRTAHKQGIELKSLVFPRNQVNESYLKICYEEGFKAIRTNPSDWFWQIETSKETMWKRLNRGVDAYFNTGDKKSFPVTALNAGVGEPLRIPASRLLRPYSPGQLYLNRLKVKRIKAEMEEAARSREMYHLWWHPHNFGHYPSENMEALQDILSHYANLNNKYGMESYSMGEIAELMLAGSQAIRKTGTG